MPELHTSFSAAGPKRFTPVNLSNTDYYAKLYVLQTHADDWIELMCVSKPKISSATADAFRQLKTEYARQVEPNTEAKDSFFQCVNVGHANSRMKLLQTINDLAVGPSSVRLEVQYISVWRDRHHGVMTCFFESDPTWIDFLCLANFNVSSGHQCLGLQHS